MKNLLLIIVLALGIATGCKQKHTHASSPPGTKDWYSATLIDAYEKSGEKNPKWDTEARKALTELADLQRNKRTKTAEQIAMSTGAVGNYAGRAVAAGCSDPLIMYLSCRFGSISSDAELIRRYCEAADKMESAGYPAIRKFYPKFRAAQELWSSKGTNAWDQIARYETSAINDYIQMMDDADTPVEDIESAGYELVEQVVGQDWALKMICDGMEGRLLTHWPKSASAHLVRAQAYYRYAWCGRGGGYAYKVTDEGWKLFGERLAVTAESANKAWELDQKNERVPLLMIELAEAQQKPREEMDLWFTRAMELNPKSYDACSKKLHYLYPQWYGSQEEMIKFGRECMESKKWGGSVPLILVDAHQQCTAYFKSEREKSDYWKRPEVWSDVKAAFEKFFAINPNGQGWHHNYAWYAYKCEQWDTLNEQLGLLGDVNYRYFGGEEEFNKIVEAAKRHK